MIRQSQAKPARWFPMKKVRPFISTLVLLLLAFTLTGCIDRIFNLEIKEVEAPTFRLDEDEDGTFLLTMLCATKGATIRYEYNGKWPNQNSLKYTEPIEIKEDTVIYAKGFKKNYWSSMVSSFYKSFFVESVAISPSGGFFITPPTITLECPTEDTVIYYSLDGSTPTEESILYEAPFEITSNCVLKARAIRRNWTSVRVTEALFNVCEISSEMVYIPGGTFFMGRTKGEGESDEYPPHNVEIAAFYMDKYPVTNGQYRFTTGIGADISHHIQMDVPTQNKTWNQAIQYCNLRSIAEGFTPVYSLNGSTDPADWGVVPPSESSSAWNGMICNWDANGYRLPTEAEWEYAARGGLNTPNYFYSGSDDINTVAWYYGNSGGTSSIVGEKSANRLGICDMSGNIREWCWDWYDAQYYANSPTSNPRGPDSGNYHVLRGGYWGDFPSYCQVSHRFIHITPFSTSYANGFRVCRSAQ